ncbi:hypothetical protein [Flavobacterium dankookense]|uniref:Uncharacterized protein n=1 Tax=Flavobacterium dankookense TaxID=706186 RepID=A0A4R6Q9V2_9FLAO|nr:hypothetical protein [Flavobacterium dankookense]TDP59404.1 hypothetical protein BC748_1654 [Flavobacterium dankookense]
MKKIILLLLIFPLYLSCNKEKQHEQKNNLDTIIVYEYEEDEKIFDPKNKNKKLVFVKTSCIDNEKKAYADIKRGKLIYFFYMNMSTTTMEGDEMKERFANSKINIRYAFGSGCIPAENEEEKNCYEKVMNKEVEKRFGIKFIDSIKKIRESVKLKYLKK